MHTECITIIQRTEIPETFIIYFSMIYFSSMPGKENKTDTQDKGVTIWCYFLFSQICLNLNLFPCTFFAHVLLK